MFTDVPLSLTPFIGRANEVDALVGLVGTTRLVTLTGAGGSGKTRLAAEVARHARAQFAGGAAWVELAPLSDPELVPTYLLAALAIEPGARRPMDAVLDSLRELRLLLVLDNCEHLVDAAAVLVESVLRGCPGLHILATSRESLGVAGERVWPVSGLAVPSGDDASVDGVANAPAVQLFVDRARAAHTSFRLTHANAAAVAQICRRLDGLPLAIELVAARVRAIAPQQLASRLDDAFRVLGTPSRTTVPRHRTLREAVDWSFNLLDAREKSLLQRLAIFAGEFTLQAAESVGAGVDLDAADVLDTLGALVDKSLVVMRESKGTARYFLLETIRQYAAGRLKDAGEYERVCQRHARTYMELVAEAAPHLITRERPRWVEYIHPELDNIRAALACTRDEDVASHLRMCGDLGWFWYSSGLWAEGRRWQEGAIALPWTDAMRHARARVLLGGAVLASLQGDPRAAIPWLEESATLFRAVGDEGGEAYALAYQGVSWGQSGDPRTEEPTTRALTHFRKSGDLYGRRLCLVVLATYYGVIGEVARARAIGEEAVMVARTYGLDRELAIALQVLAAANLSAGGEIARVEQLVRESVAALERDPSLFWSARALHLIAIARMRRGDHEGGARLLGTAAAVREKVGAGLMGPDRAHMEPVLHNARAALGDEAFDAAWNAGRDVSLAAAFAEILSHAPPTIAPAVLSSSAGAVRERAAPLHVRALGPLEILRDGVPVPGDAWRYARPRELLLFLLAHPHGRTRHQIGVVFWPDASPTQVKNNFHVMLHHVRKVIGSDLIVFEKERYRMAWEAGVRFDAAAFEQELPERLRALRSARGTENVRLTLDAALDTLALYRGDFLCDAGAGDWHLEIRDRLRRVYMDAELLVGDRSLELELHRQAAEAFRAAIRVDDLHEEAHRGLMRALARSGDRTEALRQYDRLALTLRRDLDSEPDEATKALYERLKRAEVV
jgi:predicted ATPase/DNA-binding SARP family transcriptional activator